MIKKRILEVYVLRMMMNRSREIVYILLSSSSSDFAYNTMALKLRVMTSGLQSDFSGSQGWHDLEDAR